MSTHNICFCWEIRKILCGYPLLSVAMETFAPSFTVKFWIAESKNGSTILNDEHHSGHFQDTIFCLKSNSSGAVHILRSKRGLERERDQPSYERRERERDQTAYHIKCCIYIYM